MGLFPTLQPISPCPIEEPHHVDCLRLDIPQLAALSIDIYEDWQTGPASMATTPKFPVYVVHYHTFFEDPHVAPVEYHTVLFVDTSSPTIFDPAKEVDAGNATETAAGDSPGPGPGMVFHVQGDITSSSGMYFASKAGKPPRSSGTYHSHRLLGYVPCWAIEENVLHHVLKTRTEAPRQQKAYNAERRRTEPFKSLEPLEFYNDEEYERRAWRRLKKCAEWVWWEAVPVLMKEGLLETVPGVEEAWGEGEG